jgi:hypothetical protein
MKHVINIEVHFVGYLYIMGRLSVSVYKSHIWNNFCGLHATKNALYVRCFDTRNFEDRWASCEGLC